MRFGMENWLWFPISKICLGPTCVIQIQDSQGDLGGIFPTIHCLPGPSKGKSLDGIGSLALRGIK